MAAAIDSPGAPKFCAVGRERAEADWKYCPWNGNRLNETAGAPSAEQKRKEAKPQ